MTAKTAAKSHNSKRRKVEGEIWGWTLKFKDLRPSTFCDVAFKLLNYSPFFLNHCAFMDEQEHEVFTAVVADRNEHRSSCHSPQSMLK